MALLSALFGSQDKPQAQTSAEREAVSAFLQGCSIEVMPRTAAKVEDFKAILAPGTRVYIAHIEGTPIKEMVETAKRLAADGFHVMPHFPARIIADAAMLEDWIDRYQGEAGVDQALLLAGGVDKPHGSLASSMDLLETGLFGAKGFKRLHVAGHPEGNKDIDPDGSDTNVMDALVPRCACCKSGQRMRPSFCYPSNRMNSSPIWPFTRPRIRILPSAMSISSPSAGSAKPPNGLPKIATTDFFFLALKVPP